MNPLPPSALMRPRVQPPAWAPAPVTRPTPASTARVGYLSGYKDAEHLAPDAIKALLSPIDAISNALTDENSNEIKELLETLIDDCSMSKVSHFRVFPVEVRPERCRIRLFTCTPTPSMKDSSHVANVLTKNSSPEQVITVLQELIRQLHECLLPTSSIAEQDEKALLSKLPDSDPSLINAVCRFFNGGGDDKSRKAFNNFLVQFFSLPVETINTPRQTPFIDSNTTH